MKNKKVLIVCILAIVIVAIGIAIGVNVSASNKYATAMELIEEYKGDFDSNDELDSKQAVYDSFVGDSTLNSYYGSNDSFDKSYDSTKEYFENTLSELVFALEFQETTDSVVEQGADSLDKIVEDGDKGTTEDSENTENEDVQTSDKENTSSDTSSSDTNNEDVTSSNETTSNEQQTSNNTESTTNSSSNNSNSTVTNSPYDQIARNTGVIWHCPAELVELAPSKGYYFQDFQGGMLWSTNDFGYSDEDSAPTFSCVAGPDGIPLPGTLYRNGVLCN